jgi:hypothetical protein
MRRITGIGLIGCSDRQYQIYCSGRGNHSHRRAKSKKREAAFCDNAANGTAEEPEP